MDSDVQALKTLEAEKDEILYQEEVMWRLKSRSLWIAAGDRNTAYFHSFVEMRRKHSAIWEIEDSV